MFNRKSHLIIIWTLLFTTNFYGQIYENSWNWGFGGIYPRYMSLSNGSISENDNLGFYSLLGYQASKHSEIRLSVKYLSINSLSYANGKSVNNVDFINLDLDLLYIPYPCDKFTPHLFVGIGFETFNSSNPISKSLAGTNSGYHVAFGLGIDIKLNNRFTLVPEFSYTTSSSNKIDGNYSINESKGLFDSNGDTYFIASFGFKYNFNIEGKKNLCEEKIIGIREPIIIKELKLDTVFVEPPKKEIEEIKLWGTNFESNKANLRIESYQLLDHAVKILTDNQELKVEIHGHTDNTGSNKYNIDLSKRRAQSVRNYLIYHGIENSRLSVIGLGEEFPISSNKTSRGRAQNRRIEFRVVK